MSPRQPTKTKTKTHERQTQDAIVKRIIDLPFAVLTLVLLSTVHAAENSPDAKPANSDPASPVSTQELKVRVSWGHSSTQAVPFAIRLVPAKPSMAVRDAAGFSLEPGE